MNYNENYQTSASQNAQIANWLLGGHTLTSLEALEKFGCMRLASRIHDLRERGYVIQTERVTTTSGKTVTQYSIGMVTMSNMAQMLAERSVTIRVHADDSVRQYFKGDTLDKVVGDYFVTYRADLIGWRKANGWYWYEPVFATKQAEWDEQQRSYCKAKSEWCAANTAE